MAGGGGKGGRSSRARARRECGGGKREGGSGQTTGRRRRESSLLLISSAFLLPSTPFQPPCRTSSPSPVVLRLSRPRRPFRFASSSCFTSSRATLPPSRPRWNLARFAISLSRCTLFPLHPFNSIATPFYNAAAHAARTEAKSRWLLTLTDPPVHDSRDSTS